jgi:hypothetical protein
MVQKHSHGCTKAFLKDRESGIFVRLLDPDPHVPNTNPGPDPGQPMLILSTGLNTGKRYH